MIRLDKMIQQNTVNVKIKKYHPGDDIFVVIVAGVFLIGGMYFN